MNFVDFILKKLVKYDDHRSKHRGDGYSNLSFYFQFGNISATDIVLQVNLLAEWA